MFRTREFEVAAAFQLYPKHVLDNSWEQRTTKPFIEPPKRVVWHDFEVKVSCKQ